MQRILAVLIMAFVTVPALAENLFVDPNNPEGFATIAEAVKRADEGDIIFISEGFYSEQISIDKNISLIGEGADMVILSYAQAGNAIDIGGTNDTTTVIEGMTITAKGGWGIAIAPGGAATIRSCTITKCGNGAININQSSAVVRLNQLVENLTGAIYAYRDKGSLITNNIIEGNAESAGRDSWGSGGTIFLQEEGTETIVANNLIKGNTGNASGAIMCWGTAPTIKNNIIVENNSSGIFLNTNSMPTPAAPLITSNIIVDNVAYGINDWQANSNEVVTYNNIFNNTEGDYFQTTSDIGDIDDDPEFVNPSKDDYHLQETSPCIDTGTPGAAHTDPDGSRNDMGIFGGPFAGFWVEPYNGPVVTSVEASPSSVQQGGTITIRATGTTVRE